MRDMSDDLSDKALKAVVQAGAQPTHDIAETIADHIAKNGAAPIRNSALTRFWQAIDRRPPLGCGAVGLEWLREHGVISHRDEVRMSQCSIDIDFARQAAWTPDCEENKDEEALWSSLSPLTREEYVAEEERVLARGRAVFHRYGPNMELGLLLVGLGGGFASGRITDVLRSTGYLMDAAKRRNGETGPTSASLGSDADKDMYLARLAAYVEQATAELAEKGLGDTPATGHSEKPKGEQQVPSQASADRTYRRLLETASFLLAVTEGPKALTPPSLNHQGEYTAQASTGGELLQQAGTGWLACIRVRFLHTGVRSRLLSSKMGSYPLGSGVPINQEDLLATLLAFSAAPLMALQMMGLSPSAQEMVDYVALWRHIGFYMGVEPRMLRRCFHSPRSAQYAFACISSHHFLPLAGRMDSSTPPPPSISSAFGPQMVAGSQSAMNANLTEKGITARPAPGAQTATLVGQPAILHFDHGPALPLLWSVSLRPPGNMAFSTLCSVMRFLLGDALSNATEVPGTTTRQYIGMRLRLLFLAYPPLFARYYPRKQWGEDLSANWAIIVRRLVLMGSKGRVATFRSRVSHASSTGKAHDDNDASVVALDPAEGRHVLRAYRRLMSEMLIATLALLVCVLLGVAWLLSMAWASFQGGAFVQQCLAHTDRRDHTTWIDMILR